MLFHESRNVLNGKENLLWRALHDSGGSVTRRAEHSKTGRLPQTESIAFTQFIYFSLLNLLPDPC